MRALTSPHPALASAIASFALALSLSCLPAHATPPQRPPATVPISAPEVLVRSIYTMPDPDFDAYTNPARRPDYYTPRIHGLATQNQRCHVEKYGMERADMSLIVPGQDYDIAGLQITLTSMDNSNAEVRVHFNQFRQKVDPVELRYLLINSQQGWRIDNVLFANTSMLAALSKPC